MEGLIRKIIIGTDPKNGLAYFLGMNAGSGKVNAIVLDEKHLHRYSIKRYLVYIEKGDDIMLWKCVDEMPCLIEFDLNF